MLRPGMSSTPSRTSPRNSVRNSGALSAWSAMHRQSARDADRLAGDESPIVACQEGDHAGIIIRLADPAEWNRAHHRVHDLLAVLVVPDERGHRRRIGRTWADGIHQNVLASEFARERLGK